MKRKLPLLAVLGLVVSLTGYSQTIDSVGTSMADMSLEDLMNIQVVSASKKSESAFEAPLSIGSVSKEEIQKAGSTSIVEALRLIPGLLVTEVTNGNYQVEIRGLNNLPPGTVLNNASNSITLVMIDNRPVYNYFSGGTFWETLPVDLNDVERIEVVRGASSALYGPNAAAGVINIITRKADKNGMYAVANAQKGSASTNIGNASVGYKFGKFDFIISGNFQDRKRTDSDYFQWTTNTKVSSDSLNAWFPGGKLVDANGNPNAKERYPDPKLALSKFGYNTFLNYNISEKSSVGVTFGGQKSTSQKAFTDNLATPLTTQASSTNYVDVRGKFNNLNTMVAYQSGTQDVAKGSYGYKYNFNTIDAVAEYDIKVKNFTFRPGVNFRNATYDDSKYSNIRTVDGFIGGSKNLLNYAGSLRGEYVNNNFKMIAALRVDKYNHPDKAYASYQITPTYKISDKHFIRTNYSRSYRGPNMYDTYNSSFIYGGPKALPVGPGTTMDFPSYAKITGNENLKLLSIDLFELGYRGKITDNFHIDVDLFHQTVQNYSFLVFQPWITPDPSNGMKFITQQTIQNISLKTIQNGVTVSANYVLNKLQVKPFVTIQATKLNNAPRYRNSVAQDSVNNINVTYDSTHTGTPSVFGGAYVNYQISKKFNANVSVYSFGSYQYNNIYSNYGKPGDGIIKTPSKFLVNARIAYKPIDKLDLFVNIRNVLNQKSSEFANTDKTKIMLLFGANFNL